MKQCVLITGANGFVGKAVVEQIRGAGWKTRVAVRRRNARWPNDVESFEITDITEATDWKSIVESVDTVVHCAARVHLLRDTVPDPLVAFRQINAHGTLKLAAAARQAGARRFVFISSIGVNGAETTQRPFTADDIPAPHTPYAQSKHEAELALRVLSRETGLEVVIIRPPLVYGPDAPGNFRRMLDALYRGIPLPLGSLNNRRSLVALDNLASLVRTCVRHPNAANQTFLVSDDHDISTTELLRRLAAALNRPARLIPVPAPVLQVLARSLGRMALAQQLCGSLQIDIARTRSLLDWSPPVSLPDALREAAQHYVMAARRQ